MNKQRDAMQFALETLEDIFGKIKTDVTAINMLREALAEPEQEPVADADLYAVWSNGFHSRKPLTDEKIMEICRELGKQCRLGGNPNIEFDYARAIERAHGIGD